SAGIVGSIFLGVRIFDAFTDPVMGVMADKTQSRWGRYRPYMLWMSVPYGIATVLVFTSFDLSYVYSVVYAVVTYSFLMVAYTAINIPYSALGGVMTSDPTERVSIQSYRFSMAWVGGLIVALFMVPMTEYLGFGDPALGYRRTMLILGTTAVAMFLICFAGTRERVLESPSTSTDWRSNVGTLLKNDQLWLVCATQVLLLTGTAGRGTATLYFAKDVLGLEGDTLLITAFISIGLIGNICGGIACGPFERHFDKATSVPKIQILVALFSLTTLIIPPSMTVAHFILSFVLGVLSALTVPMIWAMVADTIDYGAHRSGHHLPGLTFSANLFAVKMGFALGGASAGWILYAFSYDGKAEVQSAAALTGISVAFAILPALGCMLSLITLSKYRLDRNEVVRIAASLKKDAP
ncbi:MAG: glycoside-pentoside-hexuronide (GPH):cation symporter, partial [Myxococcota bacterium]